MAKEEAQEVVTGDAAWAARIVEGEWVALVLHTETRVGPNLTDGLLAFFGAPGNPSEGTRRLQKPAMPISLSTAMQAELRDLTWEPRGLRTLGAMTMIADSLMRHVVSDGDPLVPSNVLPHGASDFTDDEWYAVYPSAVGFALMALFDKIEAHRALLWSGGGGMQERTQMAGALTAQFALERQEFLLPNDPIMGTMRVALYGAVMYQRVRGQLQARLEAEAKGGESQFNAFGPGGKSRIGLKDNSKF